MKENLQTTESEAIAHSRGYEPLYVVMFSGGRTSAFLSKLVKENPKYKNVLFMFQNTGMEREETLVFIDRCDKEFGLNLVWIEAAVNPEMGKGTRYKVVDFSTASRKRQPFEDSIRKYGLPNNLRANCTRDLKTIPGDAYLRDHFKENNIFKIYGIRADEPHRKSAKADIEQKLYPLCDDFKVNSVFIRSWWQKQNFDLELKDYQGNCDLCLKKSLKKKLTLIRENPDSAKWWQEMEEKYGDESVPRFDLRTNVSVSQMIEMAKRPFITRIVAATNRPI